MMDADLPAPAWRWFVPWVLLGFVWPWVFLGALSIGPFLLPLAALGTWLLLRRPVPRASAPAILAGMGLSLLVVAFLNRGGPGVVCVTSTTATSWSQSCGEQWNPWPWLGFGLMLIVFGVGEFARRQRSTT